MEWKILAVWPSYDHLGEYHKQDAQQMYDTGLEYTALHGPDASRAGIARQLQDGGYNILEVLAHGENGAIHLHDGPTEPGWWGRLATSHPIHLVVFLSCESSSPRQNNATKSLLRAGVEYVISADRKLEAHDAIAFAALFYSSLADGLDVESSFVQAELAMTRESAEMVRLHASKKKSHIKDDMPTEPRRDSVTDVILNAIDSVRQDVRELREDGAMRGDMLKKEISDLRHESRTELAAIKPLVGAHGKQLEAYALQLKAHSEQLDIQARGLAQLENRPEKLVSRTVLWWAFAIGASAAFLGDIVSMWLRSLAQ